jgi:hypothetical protein
MDGVRRIRGHRLRLAALTVLVGALVLATAASAAPPAPNVSFSPGGTPPNPTNQTSALFGFEADKPNVVFQCSLDGIDIPNCGAPQTNAGVTDGVQLVEGLTEGLHTFMVSATDNGDTGPVASYTWRVDLTPPALAITSGPPPSSNSTVATFEFASTDVPAPLFMCAIDSDALADCASPYSTLELGEGPHTFTVQARDAAGNTTTATYDWTIDTKPPTVTITSQPAATTSETTATFTFDVDETAAAACSLDGSAFAACGSPVSYSDLAPGSHSFAVQAVDAAGNTGSPAVYEWSISPLTVVEVPPVVQQPPTVVPDTTAPDTVDPIEYFVAYHYLELTWTRPPDGDFSHVTVFRRTSAGGRVAVYSGPATRYLDASFNNALDYRYDVISYDATGNASPSVTVAISSSTLLASPRPGARVRRPPTLAWASISRARFYNVQLFRNGRKVMSTWPRRSRVHLAPRWHYAKHAYALTRGRYDWYVWPAFRSGGSIRYGPAIGHSFFRR